MVPGSKDRLKHSLICLTVSPAATAGILLAVAGDLSIIGDHDHDCEAFIPSHLGSTAQNSTVNLGDTEYFSLSCPDILGCPGKLAADH
jgi:hypothetical protein